MPSSSIDYSDEDAKYLVELGYKPTLTRVFSLVESVSASFSAIYILNGLRALFSIGMTLGGPQAYWVTWIIGSIFVLITSAVLAEVLSSLPCAGSIYFWAAESAGPKYGRLVGFVVAWWSSTAWTSFVASNSQVAANYLLSEIDVFGLDFPTDVHNVKFRAVQWIVSEGMLILAMVVNYVPARWYKRVFQFAAAIQIVDFLLNIIWLPIGVANTYGFQPTEFLHKYNNLSGGPNSWAWMLTFFSTIGVVIGMDASGHIAEETKNATLVASRGLFWSAVASVGVGTCIVFLFLKCTPDLEIILSFSAPQPFVNLYALALGKRAHVAMTVISILGTLMSTSCSVVAASRLVYAIARDGVLPFSSWIGKVSRKTGQPENAVTVIGIVAAILLCTILPSSVAFQSLVSCAGVPTICAYGTISFCRLVITRDNFRKPRYSLGVFSKPFQLISFLWNTFLFAILISPLEFPVNHSTFNYSPAVLGGITIFAIVSWTTFSEEQWLTSLNASKVESSPSKV